MSIGSGCYRVGTSIHEIMHVLGFFHEMARPDRDEYIKIHWEYIKKGKRSFFTFVSLLYIYSCAESCEQRSKEVKTAWFC